MADLLRYVSVLLLRVDIFERFAQKRVERFRDPTDSARVIGHGKSSDVGDTFR